MFSMKTSDVDLFLDLAMTQVLKQLNIYSRNIITSANLKLLQSK